MLLHHPNIYNLQLVFIYLILNTIQINKFPHTHETNYTRTHTKQITHTHTHTKQNCAQFCVCVVLLCVGVRVCLQFCFMCAFDLCVRAILFCMRFCFWCVCICSVCAHKFVFVCVRLCAVLLCVQFSFIVCMCIFLVHMYYFVCGHNVQFSSNRSPDRATHLTNYTGRHSTTLHTHTKQITSTRHTKRITHTHQTNYTHTPNKLHTHTHETNYTHTYTHQTKLRAHTNQKHT